jgi:hypothetical protein
MWFFRRPEKARFPRKNGKNRRATPISHKLISVALNSLAENGGGFADTDLKSKINERTQ